MFFFLLQIDFAQFDDCKYCIISIRSMRKTYEKLEQNSNILDLDSKQNLFDFKRRFKINIKPTEIAIKLEEAKNVEQNKFLELQQFKRSKIKIEKVINQSKIKMSRKSKSPIQLQFQEMPSNTKIQQEDQEYIPCSFCAKPLLLIDLGHIEICVQGKKCKYCEQKYPVSLFIAHLQVCKSKPTYDFKRNFQVQNRRIIAQTRQNLFIEDSTDKFTNIQKNKKPINQKKIKKEEKIGNSFGIERIYSAQMLPSYRRVQAQVLPLHKEREQIRQNVQAPVNYAELFDQRSRLRAEKQKGFSKRELQSLKRETWNGTVGDCVICSEDYKQKAIVMRLPCSHIFHEDCLLPWLQGSRRCPTCRNQM